MTRPVELVKMEGAGNDFVVLDAAAGDVPRIDAALAGRLCDRRLGVGADQLLVLREPSDRADVRMEIWNADGSPASMCANGVRAVHVYLRDRGRAPSEWLRVETPSGVVRSRWRGGGRVATEMGRPVFAPAKIPTSLGSGDGPVVDAPLDLDGRTLRVTCLSMGNPHAVLFVGDDVDAVPVEVLGPRIERHPSFPDRANVEFVEVTSRGRVRQRTWERGSGETLACGSGACAAAVAAILRGATDRRVVVSLRGGELEVSWEADDAPVVLCGPATEVFTGRIELGEGPGRRASRSSGPTS